MTAPALSQHHEYMRRVLNPALEQTMRRLAEASAVEAVQRQHLNSVFESIGQSAMREFNNRVTQSLSRITETLRVSQSEVLRTVEALRENLAFRAKISPHTFDIAHQLLEDLDFSEVDYESGGADAPQLSQEESDELEEAIRAFAPSTDGMPPAAARACAVYFMATVAFLLYIQFSLAYPDASSLAGNGGMTAFVAAIGAAKVTGVVWDKTFPADDGDHPEEE